MARWCPACRSEWWREPATCPDCGVPLVDDEPPEPERVHHEPRDLGDEVEVDLAGAGESRRWRIELDLNNAELPFRWEDSRLRTVEVAIPTLDALGLLDIDEPDDDPVTERPPFEPAMIPPLRIAATRTWWAVTTLNTAVRYVFGTIALIGLGIWLLQQLLR